MVVKVDGDGGMPHETRRRQSATSARVLGSAAAGGLELLLFHPVDTVAKRLMSSSAQRPENVSTWSQQGLQHFSRVVFREASELPFARRYASLFPGLGFAASYKLLQRVYKFGGQPVASEWIHDRWSSSKTISKPLREALAGAAVGLGEIVLLPLDVLKIKSQTNAGALTGGAFHALREATASTSTRAGGSAAWSACLALRELYRGAGWTAMRNVPGSFALFGGSQATKTYFFGLRDNSSETQGKMTPQRATFAQHAVSSVVGSILSIVASAPLDVVKTRVQSCEFGKGSSGFTIVAKIMKNEGGSAFFKGLVPKLVVVGPKLIFSFTVAQWLIEMLEDKFNPPIDFGKKTSQIDDRVLNYKTAV